MVFLVVSNDLFSRMQAYKTLDFNLSERKKLKENFLSKIKSALTQVR